MSLTIDLNADLGELPGAAGRESDAAILDVVTSCAIACGSHAGDADIMEKTLQAAARHGVEAGAHPSYPDRENFGRKSMDIAPDELVKSLREQLQTLQIIAARIGVPLTHVKPHGALYNDAARSASIASSVMRAVTSCFGHEIAIVGPPGSETEIAAKASDLEFHAEGFMDRTYLPDGSLMPRGQHGAVLHDTESRLRQAREIVLTKSVSHASNGKLSLDVDTLCLHGDSPGAVDTAHAVRKALEAEGVVLKAAGSSI